MNANVFPHGKVELDLGQLQALPQAQIRTATIWTDGPHLYTGVMLQTLIDRLQIDGPTLQLSALNDYQIRMPTAEATAEAPLLAYLEDGKPMAVRDKGPIWIIYPFDSDPKYQTIETYDRSVWQLDRIEVLP